MNRTRTLLASVLVLAAAASGCGDSEKIPATKNFPQATSSKGAKGVADEAARHAVLNTGVVRSAGLSKGVGRIALGETVEGTLAPDATTSEEGKNQDLWVLELASPADVQISMTSSDVDAYLDLDEVVKIDENGAPVLEHLAEDDDGFGGTNAALQGRLAAGTFVVFATSYEAGVSGSYSLTVKEAQPPAEASEGVAFSASLEPGNTYEGELTDNDPTLDDGTHYQLIRFQGRAGDEMTATLSSEDFDPYLILALGDGDLSGLERLVENDDADTATVNSQITFPLPTDGIYTLVVNSYEEDTGAYELHLETALPDYSRFSAGDTDPEGRYALLVGIDDYPGTGSDLTGPTHDAEMMAQVLLDGYMFEPQNVVLLENAEATRLNIANGIIRHLGKAGPNGVAVFFFSGHGTRVGRNVGFLDNEADGQDDGIYVYGYGGESSVILDEELGYLLSQLKGNTFVAVDACYSGTISRAEGGPQAKSADITSPDVANNIRLPKTFISDELGAGYAFGSAGDMSNVFNQPQRSVVMSSSSEEQVSWTVNDWPDGSPPASLFTYYLAKEMRNASGAVTFRDLLRRVSQQVDAYVSNSGGKYEAQTTQLVGPGLERPIRSFMLGF
jgi:hypothetical protein